MRASFTRHHIGQTAFGLFGNVWPTETNRIDRQTIGVWYLALHLGTCRFDLCGKWGR